jgi:hypothetical protein
MPTSVNALLREIAVRQHRALRTAGRPRRVENRGDVVRRRGDGIERRRLVVGAIEQRSLAGLERQHLRLRSQRRELGGRRAADDTEGSASPKRYESSPRW